MSTDWIKMRCDLRTHPKVVRMSSELKSDKLRIVGGLHAVWCIFDAHAVDGVLEAYTFREIDDQLGWNGFAAAMNAIGWLDDIGSGLSAPRFDEHNSQSAKRRAMDTERKRLERESEKEATKQAQLSASDADKMRTREEKRREEKEQETTEPSVLVADPPPEGSIDPPTSGGYAVPSCPTAELLSLYAEHLPMLPQVAVLSDTRRRHLAARWRQVCVSERYDRKQGLEWFVWLFGHVAKSPFLTGNGRADRDGRVWRADLDWLLTPAKFALVVEGRYHAERAAA